MVMRWPTWLAAAAVLALLAACAEVLREAERGAAPVVSSMPAASAPIDLLPAWNLNAVRLTRANASAAPPFPPAGGFITFMRPTTLAVQGSELLVADIGRAALLRLDPISASAIALSVPALSAQLRFALLPDRSVLVLDGTRAVTLYDRNGALLRSLAAAPLDLAQPVDVVWDETRGRLLVADGVHRRLVELRPAALAWRVLPVRDAGGAGLSSIAALAVSARAIYVADPACGCVVMLSPEAQVLGRFQGELQRPERLAVDAAERVYVADSAARVLRVFVAGRQTQQFAYRALGVTEIGDLRVRGDELVISAPNEARVLALRIAARSEGAR